MANQQYLKLNTKKLRKQLEKAKPPVVAILHHVPKRESLRYTGNPEEDFDLAYTGSPMLGEILEKHRDKITAIVYGHIHEYSRSKIMYINNIPYVNAYYSSPINPGYTLIEYRKYKWPIQNQHHYYKITTVNTYFSRYRSNRSI